MRSAQAWANWEAVCSSAARASPRFILPNIFATPTMPTLAMTITPTSSIRVKPRSRAGRMSVTHFRETGDGAQHHKGGALLGGRNGRGVLQCKGGGRIGREQGCAIGRPAGAVEVDSGESRVRAGCREAKS